MLFLRIIVFLVGAIIVLGTLFSAIRTFVLPRSSQDFLTRTVFSFVGRLFSIIVKSKKTYLARDRILAFYAPVSLIVLVPVWLSLLTIGYTGMFWGAGISSFYTAFRISGSSILTLGFENGQTFFQTILMFTAGTFGLLLIALLIAYLPTIYAAFSRREILVKLLEVRAGNPPSAIELIKRYHRIHGLENLKDQWIPWENWFSDIEESHTSLPALVFFRSPKPTHSWVTASAAVLDSAALVLSSLDIPESPNAALCIRAGYLALRSIADFFNIAYEIDPHFPEVAISVSREEFEQALDELAKAGVPLKSDRDRAWVDYGGWRVNYDKALLGLAQITMAPAATWTGVHQ